MDRGPLVRKFVSEGAIYSKPAPLVDPHSKSLHSKSVPLLTKCHPLLDLDDNDPHTFREYIYAAETLENIINEGNFIGTIKSRYFSNNSNLTSRSVSDKVLKLVYGTMKCNNEDNLDLPYLDSLLVKTQFLVYNNQFLDSLGLVKIMIFDLMKHHFNYKSFPGINYEIDPSIDLKYQKACVDLVKDLEETLCEFQVKLGAAYGRLRIEKGASGETAIEQMHNVLPSSVREKEEMAIDLIKTLRVNTLKTDKDQVAQILISLGFKIKLVKATELTENDDDSTIHLDDHFSDLLVIPPRLFSQIKDGPLVNEGYLIFQDKASLYCPEQMRTAVKPGDFIIDARTGCGTKLAELSKLVGKKGKIFAFEHRPARLETLYSNLEKQGCKNVTVIESEFGTSNFKDPQFENVTTIVVEAVNSGTTIVDKLGYMLQEEEYPVDCITKKDLYTLKRQQTAILKSAFKFPKVKNILYVTRSIHPEENEMVVTDVLDRYGVDWKLTCVLPDIPSDQDLGGEHDIEECLTIYPSVKTGNGIFIANFQLKEKVKPVQRTEDPEVVTKRISEMTVAEIQQQQQIEEVKPKRKKKEGRKKGERLKIRLPKSMRLAVERLSKPKRYIFEDLYTPTELIEIKKLRLKVFGEISDDAIPRDFFGPRNDALRIIKEKNQKMKGIRWSLPTIPWK